MKKITKKMIDEAPRFLVTIDYKAGRKPANVQVFDYVAADVDSVFKAIEFADQLFSEDVYLLRIAEKAPMPCQMFIDGTEGVLYIDKLCSRHASNWHLATQKNSEVPHGIGYNPLLKSCGSAAYMMIG